MRDLVDAVAGLGPLARLPWEGVAALVLALVALAFAGIAAVVGGFLTYVERRVAARMQFRIGPNRVGPQGVLQWAADAVKLLLKEDLIPELADRPLFRLAPYLVFCGSFLTFVVLPFGRRWIVSDLNIGVLYLMAVSNLVVIGILMGGWASNNKWSMLGAMRSAAQMVSYEIPVGLSLLIPVLVAGSLSTGDIVRAQGGFRSWMIFQSPFSFAAFFIYAVAAQAENNRAPFDLPEAESELVSGFSTEYSGLRYAMFYLAEFLNIFLIGIIGATVFLGGWQVPAFLGVGAGASWIGFFGLVLKASAVLFLNLWLRWTLPRLRVDQLMQLCWKYLVPMGFVNVAGACGWFLWFGPRHFFAIFP